LDNLRNSFLQISFAKHALFVTGADQAPGYGGIIPDHWKKKRSEILGEESSATNHDP